jgi:hypothetical protein
MAKKKQKAARGTKTTTTRKAGSAAKRGTKAARKAGRAASTRRGAPARKAGKKSVKKAAKKARRAARPASRPATRAAKSTRTTTAAKRAGTSRRPAVAKAPSRGPARKSPPTRPPDTDPRGRATRKAPGLDRDRRTIREEENLVGPPSSLDLDRSPSAARSGRRELAVRLREHTSTGPAMTGGDVDADWEDAETVGDEAPGGDNPTPDQDVVEEIGQAIGITYDDNEELQGGDELNERDRHRWELDPASREDTEEE